MSEVKLPSFPDDVPKHPLLVVDYQLVKAGDTAEIDKLWDAATKLGFWYLKNHDADADVRAMFEMGEETMQLPLDEKMKYEQGDEGSNFGYKAAGASTVDPAGTVDSVEFINVAKDDALAYPSVVHRTYPKTVNARIQSTVKPFTLKAIDICNTLIGALNDRLGLPHGKLNELHRIDRPSFCQSRCTKNPPARGVPADKPALGQHTDYGSLSFLHNRLGGLQVMPPGTSEWCYIEPLPGHAICNVGDALALFSGGILRSSLHRVVAPPGAQAAHERWSLVYFHRPHNGVPLAALARDSAMIADAVAAAAEPGQYSTGETADAWLMRRVRMRRTKNMTGPDAWRQGLGTEHDVRAQNAVAREVPAY